MENTSEDKKHSSWLLLPFLSLPFTLIVVIIVKIYCKYRTTWEPKYLFKINWFSSLFLSFLSALALTLNTLVRPDGQHCWFNSLVLWSWAATNLDLALLQLDRLLAVCWHLHYQAVTSKLRRMFNPDRYLGMFRMSSDPCRDVHEGFLSVAASQHTDLRELMLLSK